MRARNQRISQFLSSIASEEDTLYNISTEPMHQFIKWSELYFTTAEKLDSKSDPLLIRTKYSYSVAMTTMRSIDH